MICVYEIITGKKVGIYDDDSADYNSDPAIHKFLHFKASPENLLEMEKATHIINGVPVVQSTLTLLRAKEIKWDEIKKARDVEELSGFDYLDKRFDSDLAAIRRISIAVQAAQVVPEFSIEWTCQDSSTVTMDKSQMVQIPITMALRGNAIHQKARALKTQIELAETVEEVEAIKWV